MIWQKIYSKIIFVFLILYSILLWVTSKNCFVSIISNCECDMNQWPWSKTFDNIVFQSTCARRCSRSPFQLSHYFPLHTPSRQIMSNLVCVRRSFAPLCPTPCINIQCVYISRPALNASALIHTPGRYQRFHWGAHSIYFIQQWPQIGIWCEMCVLRIIWPTHLFIVNGRPTAHK